MRRFVTAFGLSCVVLSVVLTPALAKGPQHVKPFPFFPIGFAAGNACEFALSVEAIQEKGHLHRWAPDANGTVHEKITGRLVLRITNQETGEWIVRNSTGVLDNWWFADGTGRAVNRGRSFLWLTPARAGRQCGCTRDD